MIYLVPMLENRRKQPVPLKSLLNKTTASRPSLFRQLESLLQLQRQLQQHIDPGLVSHCSVANYRNGILTLHTRTAHWATKLRYSVPGILNSIRNNPLPVNVKSIRIIVSPETTAGSVTRKRRPRLSKHTAKVIEQIADSISDADLSASIRRLCRNSSLKQ
ncbi:MAG: DciA family protein [Thiotrichales bacterium]|nr:DciA family protein [Thiotrichales bacterium]